jgi:uncharacterized protein (DUF1684 family)
MTVLARFGVALAAALLAFGLAGCGNPRSESAGADPAGGADQVTLLSVEQILEQRAEKDAVFRDPASSPLKPEDIPTFAGLEYYDPDPAFQFKLPLNRYPTPEQVAMPYTAGDGAHPTLRWGYFEIEVEGQLVRVEVYRPLERGAPADHLFIPFRDGTTGKETYPTGRYIEFPYRPGGWYALDFNLAFYPFCYYNPKWSCPLPPRENTFSVAIRAGERGTSGHPPEAGEPEGSPQEAS